MESQISNYKVPVYTVNYQDGAFIFFKRSEAALMECYDCYKVVISLWAKKVEVKFKTYHLSPEMEAIVTTDFPNNVVAADIRKKRAEPDAVPKELPFAVKEALYNQLYPSYKGIFNLSLSGMGSAIEFFHEPENPVKPNLTNRAGMDLFDAAGNRKHQPLLSVSATAETAEGANDGLIHLTIDNAWSGGVFEWAIDDGQNNLDDLDWRTTVDAQSTPLIDGIGVDNHEGIPPGTYAIRARETTDKHASLQFNVVVPVYSS